MLYLVSYDLTSKEKNYEAIDQAIDNDKSTFKKAVRALESQWVVHYTGADAESLYKHLHKLVRPVDKLLVVCLDKGDWFADNATSTKILNI